MLPDELYTKCVEPVASTCHDSDSPFQSSGEVVDAPEAEKQPAFECIKCLKTYSNKHGFHKHQMTHGIEGKFTP